MGSRHREEMWRDTVTRKWCSVIKIPTNATMMTEIMIPREKANETFPLHTPRGRKSGKSRGVLVVTVLSVGSTPQRQTVCQFERRRKKFNLHSRDATLMRRRLRHHRDTHHPPVLLPPFAIITQHRDGGGESLGVE